ncbi:MAG: hypothetical protein ACE5FY_05010 [Nitrospiria bacterium]
MKNSQKIRSTIGIVTVFFVLFGVIGFTMACSNLGNGKHMGIVKIIDPIKGILTIVDAETRQAIPFITKDNLLKTVHVNDTVVITFEKNEGHLISKSIVVHAVEMGIS